MHVPSSPRPWSPFAPSSLGLAGRDHYRPVHGQPAFPEAPRPPLIAERHTRAQDQLRSQLRGLAWFLGLRLSTTSTGLPAILVYASRPPAPGELPEVLFGVPIAFTVIDRVYASPETSGQLHEPCGVPIRFSEDEEGCGPPDMELVPSEGPDDWGRQGFLPEPPRPPAFDTRPHPPPVQEDLRPPAYAPGPTPERPSSAPGTDPTVPLDADPLRMPSLEPRRPISDYGRNLRPVRSPDSDARAAFFALQGADDPVPILMPDGPAPPLYFDFDVPSPSPAPSPGPSQSPEGYPPLSTSQPENPPAAQTSPALVVLSLAALAAVGGLGYKYRHTIARKLSR
jgi:hypothetical protein